MQRMPFKCPHKLLERQLGNVIEH